MKKGFTLIEVLAILVIIGLLSSISIVTLQNIERNSKEKLYNEQVERIESAAKLWTVENGGSLYNKNIYYLRMNQLLEENFLTNDDIYDPRNNSKMNGCVVITYENDEYSYTYKENCE